MDDDLLRICMLSIIYLTVTIKNVPLDWQGVDRYHTGYLL
jgi:hypothetical protein